MVFSFFAFIYSITCLPFLLPGLIIFTILYIILTSIGKSIGFRKGYANLLHKIFEYGQRRIEIGEFKKYNKYWNYEDSEESINPNDPTKRKSVIYKNGIKPRIESEDSPECDHSSETDTAQSQTNKKPFHLADSLDFIKAGVEAIIEDEVTIRFDAEELTSWNLLTRTNKNYHQFSKRLIILWALGFFIRYCIFLPFRLFIFGYGLLWFVGCNSAIGFLPDGRVKRFIYNSANLMCFRILARVFSTTVTYHNRENRAKGGIVVANHTSPLDVLILNSDHCYSYIGQRHPGLLGLLERSLSRATTHVWFERDEMKDRELVSKRLKEHIMDPDNLPILIFPEGTCINNTSVMMFKKGSFEVADVIYPIAIKYDPKYGDAFWNSSRHGYFHYLLRIMSSWAIVCEVWYLPPMTRKPGEKAADFAKRVKAEIARQGGLVDLDWDGQLKRTQVKRELKERQQYEYFKRLKID